MLAWAILAGAASSGARADSLVTTIVTDPLTGVAMDGYDPVSYFTGGDPQLGNPDFEYDWGGVPWYFISAANRDVFSRAPQVYAPQYGGHCLMSLSRGYLSDGKPRLYVIDALKLYFFYSAANREAFLLSRSDALQAAAKNWPELSKDLSGPDSALPASGSLGDNSGASSDDGSSMSASGSPDGSSVTPDAGAVAPAATSDAPPATSSADPMSSSQQP